MSKDIQIAIIDDMSANGKEEFFEVELFDISEGAKFGGVTRTKAIKNDWKFQKLSIKFISFLLLISLMICENTNV